MPVARRNALQFAAGERVAGSVEREVVEADFSQEAEAGGDLGEDGLGDGGVVGRKDREWEMWGEDVATGE